MLAGGASHRFEGNKAAVIGPLVLSAFRAAGIDPVVAIGGVPGVLPIPTIADRYPGEGPLGAIATALTFARTGYVIVATCDLPCLDAAALEAVQSRASAVDPTTAVVAAIGGHPQLSLGAWPASWSTAVHRAMRSGERRLRHMLDLGEIEQVEIEPLALADADDRNTLATLLAEGRPSAGPATGTDRDMPDPSSPGA